jgi:hypothetical protein
LFETLGKGIGFIGGNFSKNKGVFLMGAVEGVGRFERGAEYGGIDASDVAVAGNYDSSGATCSFFGLKWDRRRQRCECS